MRHLSRIGFELSPMNWFKDAGNLQPTLGFEQRKKSRRFIRKSVASLALFSGASNALSLTLALRRVLESELTAANSNNNRSYLRTRLGSYMGRFHICCAYTLALFTTTAVGELMSIKSRRGQNPYGKIRMDCHLGRYILPYTRPELCLVLPFSSHGSKWPPGLTCARTVFSFVL